MKIIQKIGALRIINIILSAALFCLAIGFGIRTLATGNPDNRFIGFVGTSLLFPLPYVLEAILKNRLSNLLLTLYMAFVVLAVILGFVFDFYHKLPAYDKIIHFVFGYLGSIFGLFLLCKLGKYHEMKPVFVCVMVFSVSLMCGAIWEIFEFMADNLLGQTTQGVSLITADGMMVTDVSDSMLDLICNFGGALVFLVHFIFHKASKKNLLIKSIIDDFA